MASRSTRLRKLSSAQQHEHQSRARWTDPLTRILVDLMVDQIYKGNRPNKSFGKKAWKCICDEFHKQTGLKWDKDQLKNRCAVLKRQYVTIKSLLAKGDFSWDEATGTIIGNDEVWDEYVKEHPDVETIRSSGCPIYKQLCTMFSVAGRNGKHDCSAECEEGTPCRHLCPEPLHMLQVESSSESEEDTEVTDEQENFQPTVPNSSGHRKRRRKGLDDDAIANAILEMAAASKLRAAAMEQCNAKFSIANCVKALDEMEGLDERIYFAALNLFDSINARETFLSLKVEKRLSWLYGKCGATSRSMAS